MWSTGTTTSSSSGSPSGGRISHSGRRLAANRGWKRKPCGDRGTSNLSDVSISPRKKLCLISNHLERLSLRQPQCHSSIEDDNKDRCDCDCDCDCHSTGSESEGEGHDAVVDSGRLPPRSLLSSNLRGLSSVDEKIDDMIRSSRYENLGRAIIPYTGGGSGAELLAAAAAASSSSSSCSPDCASIPAAEEAESISEGPDVEDGDARESVDMFSVTSTADSLFSDEVSDMELS
jgi:hypothetical protein